jgi:HD-GYP domain-containing protein (c-di-GMP phosphodiesterase class II)
MAVISLGAGVIGHAARERRMIHVPDVRRDPRYIMGLPETAAELAIPLLVGDELIGVLNVESAKRHAFGPRDIKVLSVIADQAAMVIQNADLFAQREQLFLATLDAMARAIDARDPSTAGHSHRVAAYAVAIGHLLELDRHALDVLRRGGVLHDIGKIGVSDAVLRKRGSLTAEEQAEMRRHPVIGHDLLRDIPFLGDELHLIRHHHERWDGMGYPDGLAGETIPLGARILAVADAFDAMGSDRPYRRALDHGEIRRRLREESGSQFWPPAVDALLLLFDAGVIETLPAEPDLVATAPR